MVTIRKVHCLSFCTKCWTNSLIFLSELPPSLTAFLANSLHLLAFFLICWLLSPSNSLINPNSCDFLFLFLFLFFYLIKINKLIFFNLDADVETLDIILIFLTYAACHMRNFHLWCNSRDKNETHFSGYGLKAMEKKGGKKKLETQVKIV